MTVELHADEGGYHEAVVELPFNYREAFHDYRIKHRPCDVSWWVDGKIVHVMKECLTQPMHTSLILRTNRPGAAPTAVMEFVEFEFEPYEAAVGRRPAGPPANASLQQLLAWHAAHPD